MRSAEFFSGYCKGQRYAAEMTNLKAQPQTFAIQQNQLLTPHSSLKTSFASFPAKRLTPN